MKINAIINSQQAHIPHIKQIKVVKSLNPFSDNERLTNK